MQTLRNSKALYVFGYYNPFRRLCSRIAKSRVFETFILLTIVCNCVTLAMTDPDIDGQPTTELNLVLEKIEIFYMVAFTLEAVLKIVAQGFCFCGPRSYIRDPWNAVDFFIVLMGYVEIIASAANSDSVNLKPLRAFRVLRPLKLITNLTSLQVVLGSIIKAVPALTHVGLLLLFLLVMYAIIGLEFYIGALNFACTELAPFAAGNNGSDGFRNGSGASSFSSSTMMMMVELDDGRRCNPNASTGFTGGGVPDPFASTSHTCDAFANATCSRVPAPNDGVTSFDNSLLAILTVFQCITLEGWTDILYSLNDANGEITGNSIYFCSLIVLGAFFVMNLVLGVLSGQFTNEGTRIRRMQESARRNAKARKRRGLREYQEWLTLGRAVDPETLAGTVPEGVHIAPYTRDTFIDIVSSGGLGGTGLSAVENATGTGGGGSGGGGGGGGGGSSIAGAGVVVSSSAGAGALSPSVSGVAGLVYPPPISPTTDGITTRAGDGSNEGGDPLLDDTELMCWLRLPDSSLEVLKVEPGQSVGELADDLFKLRPEFTQMRLSFLVSQTNRPIINRKRSLASFEPALRLLTARERDQIDVMDVSNRAIVMKGSTLQLLHPLGVVLKSAYVTYFISILVLLNTISISIRMNFPAPGDQNIFRWVEVGFVATFGLEVLLKMWAFGVREYFRSKFNRFDCCVILASVVELAVCETTGMAPVGISVLRCIRLLRFFRYTRYWEDMNDFSTALLNSTSNILSLLLLLFIFILIAALLGMQAFGGRLGTGPLNVPPRTNFDNFYNAVLAVFQVLTGEDWNAVMYTGIEAYGGIGSYGFVAVLYFCAIVVLGTFVLLNVFLAIAVNSITDAKSLKAERNAFKPMERSLGNLTADEIEEARTGRSYANPLQQRLAEEEEAAHNAAGAAHQSSGPGGSGNAHSSSSSSSPSSSSNKWLMQPMGTNRTLFIFSPKNRFRRAVHQVAFDRRFDAVILLSICVSSILLAVEDPFNESADINDKLYYVDVFFASLFTLEMVMKWVGMGLLQYVKDPWNDLDLIVVASSLVSIALVGSDLAVVRILRVLRVLRPLRTINRVPGLRHVVVCMVNAVKIISNVFIITFLLIFVFSVIGTMQWSQTFGSCNDPHIGNETACSGAFAPLWPHNNDTIEREWDTPPLNFNTLGVSLMTLFAVSTLEGWVDVMHSAMDATGPGLAPVENNRPAAAMFFVVYIVLLAFFMLNVFVGFVILTFSEEGESRYEAARLDKNQRDCLAFVLSARPIKNFAATFRMQKGVHRLVTSTPFEYFIMAIIVANSLFLMLKFDGQSQEWVLALDIGNYVFTAIFTLEAVLKLFAFNPSGYFADAWNFFDFVIVIGSLVDIALSGEGVSVGFLRLFRAARLLKLFSRGENMKRLLWTFAQAFKSLPYVALLILMVFYVYAIVGMMIFGRVQLNPEGAINVHNNFRTFGGSLLLLFRAATGENWQAMMVDCVLSPPDACQLEPADGGSSTCGSAFAYFYFISFVVICSFLVLNLFIAVIMDNFEYLTMDESELGAHSLSKFVDAWAHFDFSGTGRIPYPQLEPLLRALQPPLGAGAKIPNMRLFSLLMQMNVPLHSDGTVGFHPTFMALVRHRLSVYTAKRGERQSSWVRRGRELHTTLKQLFPRTDVTILNECFPRAENSLSVGVLYAVRFLQANFRERRRLRALQGDPGAAPIHAGNMAQHPSAFAVRQAASLESLDLGDDKSSSGGGGDSGGEWDGFGQVQAESSF